MGRPSCLASASRAGQPLSRVSCPPKPALGGASNPKQKSLTLSCVFCASLKAMPPLAKAGAKDFVVTTEVRAFPSDVGDLEGAVLRWFERCRTDSVGGAEGLAALKEAGVLVVVGKIAKGAMDHSRLDEGLLGRRLLVRSVVKILRKGAVVKFVQQLLDSEDAASGECGGVLASAEVTCAAISAADGAIAALPEATLTALTQAAAGREAGAAPSI